MTGNSAESRNDIGSDPVQASTEGCRGVNSKLRTDVVSDMFSYTLNPKRYALNPKP